MLYTMEFSFRSNGLQWRSTCVFGVYIQVSLIEFFEESMLFKVGNFLNILKILIESIQLCIM